MKPKARIEPRRTKLLPLLDIDEDGVPVAEVGPWNRQRWSSDDEAQGVQLDEWPSELDD